MNVFYNVTLLTYTQKKRPLFQNIVKNANKSPFFVQY